MGIAYNFKLEAQACALEIMMTVPENFPNILLMLRRLACIHDIKERDEHHSDLYHAYPTKFNGLIALISRYNLTWLIIKKCGSGRYKDRCDRYFTIERPLRTISQSKIRYCITQVLSKTQAVKETKELMSG